MLTNLQLQQCKTFKTLNRRQEGSYENSYCSRDHWLVVKMRSKFGCYIGQKPK